MVNCLIGQVSCEKKTIKQQIFKKSLKIKNDHPLQTQIKLANDIISYEGLRQMK